MIGVLRREGDRTVAGPPRPVARAAEQHFTGVRRKHADQQLEQGGLAGAIRSRQAIGRAAREREVDRAEDGPAAPIGKVQAAHRDRGRFPARQIGDEAAGITGEFGGTGRAFGARPGGQRRRKPVVDQRHRGGLSVARIEIGEGSVAILRIELLERRVDRERREVAEREAVQREQHLLAAREGLRLPLAERGEIERREREAAGGPRPIDVDLVGDRAGESRQRGLRMGPDIEALGREFLLAQQRHQGGAASGKIGTADQVAAHRHGSPPIRSASRIAAAASTTSSHRRSRPANNCGLPATSARSSRTSVFSTGHLSRMRPSTIVIALSHTAWISRQKCTMLRSDAARVSVPAAINAVWARSIAWRSVSISESVTTRTRLTAAGRASARTNPSGVSAAKRRKTTWTTATMKNSRPLMAAT